MFASYMTITLRNLLKYKFYAFISIMGLALGMACFTVLFLLIQHENNYDTFHRNSDKIVRVTEIIEQHGIGEHSASVPFPTGQALLQKYPEYIEKTVRLFDFQAPFLLISNPKTNKKYNEKNFYFADSTFLEIFDFPLQRGNPKTALSRPNSVILTPRMVRKYFKTKQVIGQKILWQNKIELEVTGVFEEIPVGSHLNFDFICSFSTLEDYMHPNAFNNRVWNPCWTYLLLKTAERSTIEELEEIVPEFVQEFFPKEIRNMVRLELQELEQIHLHSDLEYELDANGDANYVLTFEVMSVFVLIIAMINFMNLATARSSLRAQEMIARKVVGASKHDLRIQFLIESIFISLIAVLPAFIMVELALPFLSDLAGNPVQNGIIDQTELSIILVCTSIITGSLSGIYPAFYLSSFTPSTVFRGAFSSSRNSKFIRSALVVLQFVISVFLLISTAVTNQQFRFLQNARLGFDKEHKIVVPIGWAKQVLGNYEAFKTELTDYEEVVSVTAMETILGRDYQTHEYRDLKKGEEFTFVPSIIVREDFINTFGIKLLAGQTFTDSKPNLEKEAELHHSYCATSDPLMGAVIVNEAYIKFRGWTASEAIGKRLGTGHSEEKIVGVVEDFHFSSLHHKIMPFILNYTFDRRKFMTKYLVMKVKENGAKSAMLHLQKVWKNYTDTPMDYFFLEDNLAKLYTKEQRLSEISGGFALISVLVAGMGLFGLTSFITEQRRREIGIRKALGASHKSLIILLSKEFLILVCIGILVAMPLSWYVMQNWLASFSYASELEVRPFLLAGFTAIHVTILTVNLYVARVVRQTPMHEINR